ncbi:MAG: histidine phosphatase family protein [Gammaproteobacteria bacterium]|nr:histidine phosphatase family protein [Gammaproteobacteria bacterium]
MPILTLVRHAKSSWKDTSLSDRDRPLNNRGKNSAPIMAERYLSRDLLPDLIISSPAQRALTTARIIAVGIGYDGDNIIQDDSLYFDGSMAMRLVIQNQQEGCEHLMLVGHNPDMTNLLNDLAGYITGNIPTCGIATLHTETPWSNIETAHWRLLDYDYPKKSQQEPKLL